MVCVLGAPNCPNAGNLSEIKIMDKMCGSDSVVVYIVNAHNVHSHSVNGFTLNTLHTNDVTRACPFNNSQVLI